MYSSKFTCCCHWQKTLWKGITTATHQPHAAMLHWHPVNCRRPLRSLLSWPVTILLTLTISSETCKSLENFYTPQSCDDRFDRSGLKDWSVSSVSPSSWEAENVLCIMCWTVFFCSVSIITQWYVLFYCVVISHLTSLRKKKKKKVSLPWM